MVRAAALAGAFFLAGGAIPLIGGHPDDARACTDHPLCGRASQSQPPRDYRGPARDRIRSDPGGIVWPVSATSCRSASAPAIVCYMLERRSSFEMITAVGAGAMVAASVVAALVVMGGPDALIKTVHDELAQGMARGQEFYKLLGIQSDDSGRYASQRHFAYDASVAGVRAAGRCKLDAAQPARVLAMGRAATADLQLVRRSFAMVGEGMAGVAVARERLRAVHSGPGDAAISRSTASSVSRRYIFARDWRSSDFIFSRSRFRRSCAA